MPRFTVHMSRTLVEYASVEVEAASLAEAEDRAREADACGAPDWEVVEYRDAEIIEIDELED